MTSPDYEGLALELESIGRKLTADAADAIRDLVAERDRLEEALDARATEGMLVLETLAKMTPLRAHRHVLEGLAIARKARAALSGRKEP